MYTDDRGIRDIRLVRRGLRVPVHLCLTRGPRTTDPVPWTPKFKSLVVGVFRDQNKRFVDTTKSRSN